jgi:nucleoside-diphosphate-sugar epimerase
MRLLVLGGTRFVGRAIVADAVARGHDVLVVSRGESGVPEGEVQWLRADRTDAAALRSLAEHRWDGVIDTWSGDAHVVEESTVLLKDAAEWYGYVSSRSVYRWPIPLGADERAPVVEPDDDNPYAVAKRAAEVAVETTFAGRSLLARAGLVLGPHEDVGRLTWWLARAADGGQMVAPAPPDRVWQYVDARDLARFLLDAVENSRTGVYNVVCPTTHGVTTQRLLDACVAATGNRAELVWVEPDVLARAGVAEWEHLPGWLALSSEAAGLHDCDVTAALDDGLICRPVEETVSDTWEWLAEIPPHRRPPVRGGLPGRRGLSAEQEQMIWWLLGR